MTLGHVKSFWYYFQTKATDMPAIYSQSACLLVDEPGMTSALRSFITSFSWLVWFFGIYSAVGKWKSSDKPTVYKRSLVHLRLHSACLSSNDLPRLCVFLD